jgi:molybdopterin/thiamine biosynthesis adenylyltransferase
MTNDERVRYSRHLIMPEVGAEGQRRLKAARVLCIGAGGLGSPAALYLAAAGVGKIGIVDLDDVDLSNLQRQILHGTKDVGRKKLDSARDRLRDINPNIDIALHECRLSAANAADIIADYEIVIDGSDNFPTRYLSNDVCVFARKPNIYGAVFRFDGQSAVFVPAISVQELKRKLDAREPIQLIDVREPFENDIARIDNAQLIPLGELPARLNELDHESCLVVHCHTGMRSAQATQLLRGAGFRNVFNLEGGIDRWSDEIDPTVQKY